MQQWGIFILALSTALNFKDHMISFHKNKYNVSFHDYMSIVKRCYNIFRIDQAESEIRGTNRY